MKKMSLLVVCFLLVFAVSASAQVNVTFRINTAAVPDTLGPNSVVQLRGAGGPLTWDGGSPVFLTNVGGDYWEGTAQFTAAEDIQVKVYTNSEHDTVYAGVAWEHQGWEGNVGTASTNRELTVPAADTTLDLQFANGWKADAGQYETPYTTNDTTTVLYVRVNVQGWEDFNANNHVVGIRGSNQVDWGQTGELGWGETYLLTQESDHVNGGSQRYPGAYFYSGAVHVPNQYLGANIQFKVVVHNAADPLTEDWAAMELNSSREDVVPLNQDTTVHWFWLNNLAPVPTDHQDTLEVTFEADMYDAMNNLGFAPDDTLEVRCGYFGTANAVSITQMIRQGVSTVWAATDTIVSTIGEPLNYQYYVIKNAVEYREVYYNFYYTGVNQAQAERRIFEPLADGAVIQDILESVSEIHRMPQFRSTEELSQDVLVTFTCDLRPAYYQVMAGDTLEDIQGAIDVTEADSVFAWGVAINGPATGGWAGWGISLSQDTTRAMFDDGTHGDAVAGDSIYSIQIQFSTDSTNNVKGQLFKFGIRGGDNEGGYGNNHVANIDDAQATAVIASQFGSIDPIFYDMWDFDNQMPTGVEKMGSQIPQTYALGRNYPNPFNPVTHFEYQLPKSAAVKVKVYNMLGKEVVTLVDTKQSAGNYLVTWNGKDTRGRRVSSGVYFYRIETKDFSKTNKMLLMK